MLGRSHPLVKRIRALRHDRAARDAEGVFLAEGIHLAREALASGAEIETALVSEGLSDDRLRDGLRRRAGRLEEAPSSLLDSLQDSRSPQPVLLVVRSRDLVPRPGPPLAVVASGIQDPGNLGAIVRTADASGATAMWACDGADLHHPRAVRATAGAIFRLPCLRGATALVLDRLGEAGVRRLGADPRRGETYDACDWTGPTALVLGGEGGGLADEARARIDGAVRIPMREGSESLSVGAAAAILLFEAARARRRLSGG